MRLENVIGVVFNGSEERELESEFRRRTTLVRNSKLRAIKAHKMGKQENQSHKEEWSWRVVENVQ